MEQTALLSPDATRMIAIIRQGISMQNGAG